MLDEVIRMKQAVENAKLSYMELEKLTGVSHSTLQRYLTGKTNRIPLDAVEKIAKATRVSASWIMGWSADEFPSSYPAPNLTEDYVTFPVIGEIAAGYDVPAVEDWTGDVIDIPSHFLHGRKPEEFFVLQVKGNSMFPTYHDGDKVLVLKQSTLNYSGQVGVVIYDGDIGTLKKVEYIEGENWMRLIPINPNYEPIKISDCALEKCRVLGIPKLLIREIEE